MLGAGLVLNGSVGLDWFEDDDTYNQLISEDENLGFSSIDLPDNASGVESASGVVSWMETGVFEEDGENLSKSVVRVRDTGSGETGRFVFDDGDEELIDYTLDDGRLIFRIGPREECITCGEDDPSPEEQREELKEDANTTWNKLKMFDLETGEWTDLVEEFPSETKKTQFSVDGERVVYSDFRNVGWNESDTEIDPGIYMLDLETGEETRISDKNTYRMVNPDIHNNFIVWSETNAKGDVFLHNLETGQTEQITDTHFQPSKPQINTNYVAWEEAHQTHLYNIKTQEKQQKTQKTTH